ncbi:hypothetical protein E5676_scaffold255G008990 [Cucumis melo var. makuwa]|uniref:Uncharacterized protein n=1 Tax=Cucumis melo var. makuwa TaxID=1194695 RepID=A0A5A7UFQ9_CUCMM|nr:hypothetical protein E6C27_scaffold120G001480 [Cucumis melo var. makuwa]TYK13280.1 hypothetical protein E5676_scaffold255G008990 [Cucumis melo var. makuwa]
MGFKIPSSFSPYSSPNYLCFFQISLSLILFFLITSTTSSFKPLPHESNNVHHRATAVVHGSAMITTLGREVDHHHHREYRSKKLEMEIKINKISKKMKKKGVVPGGFKSSNNNKKNDKGSAFSVMLPKGFVPPSGSSPCHNENPQSSSLAFYCHLDRP